MRDYPRRNPNQRQSDGKDSALLETAMRARGWRKLVLATVVTNQVLTSAFVYFAQQIDPALTMLDTLVFSCATCMLVGRWLRTDAHRAWRNAVDKGYVGPRPSANDDDDDDDDDDGDVPAIADRCPRRWLVVLHIELNPELAATA